MEPRPNPNQSTLSIGKGASQNKLVPLPSSYNLFINILSLY